MSLRPLAIGVLLGIVVGFLHPIESLAYCPGDTVEGCIDAGGSREECERLCGREHEVKQFVPGIKLIQPLDDDFGREVPVDFRTPQATWLHYFMRGSAWLLEVCIGIVAIWILICGSAMILVGDANKAWRTKMFTAIVGLIALIFTVVILNFLNANFFAR